MGYRNVFGLDVHARSITAAVVNAETGEVKTKTLRNDPRPLDTWMSHRLSEKVLL